MAIAASWIGLGVAWRTVSDATTGTSNWLKWQPLAGLTATPFEDMWATAHSSSKNASVTRLRGDGRVPVTAISPPASPAW
jgi:hypothetical protein